MWRAFFLAALALPGDPAIAAFVITPDPSALGTDSFSQAWFEAESMAGGRGSGEFGGPGHQGIQSWVTPFGTHNHRAQGGLIGMRSGSSWLMGSPAHQNTSWVNARGGSAAFATDRIRVTLPANMGQAQQGSTLKFNWSVDGILAADIASYSSSPLSVRNGWEWGYYSDVEAWFSYVDLNGEHRQTLLQREIQRTGDSNPRLEQRWYQEYLDDDQVFNNRIVPEGTFEWQPDLIRIDKSDIFSELVLAVAGSEVPVFFGLSTGYNARFRMMDTDPDMGSEVRADFGSTMKLVSVQLFNPDGSPYIGDWSLESAAGLDYNELIVQAPAVPLPGTLALTLAALVGARRRARRPAPDRG